MGITHAKVSAIADDSAASARGEVLPSDWNADHTIAPPLTLIGGTVTTSTPLIDATQTWNAGGVTFTGWKLNVTDTASASGSKLVDLQYGGSSCFFAWNDTGGGYGMTWVVKSKATTAKECWVAPDQQSFVVIYNSNQRAVFDDSSGMRLCNYAEGISWATSGTNCMGARDTGLHKSAAGIVEINNGTAGTYRDIRVRNVLAAGGNGSYVQTPSMTVANLAAAATAGAGARAFVTDATATTFLSTVAGGGANKVPVVSDGTNWLIG